MRTLYGPSGGVHDLSALNPLRRRGGGAVTSAVSRIRRNKYLQRLGVRLMRLHEVRCRIRCQRPSGRSCRANDALAQMDRHRLLSERRTDMARPLQTFDTLRIPQLTDCKGRGPVMRPNHRPQNVPSALRDGGMAGFHPAVPLEFERVSVRACAFVKRGLGWVLIAALLRAPFPSTAPTQTAAGATFLNGPARRLRTDPPADPMSRTATLRAIDPDRSHPWPNQSFLDSSPPFARFEWIDACATLRRVAPRRHASRGCRISLMRINLASLPDAKRLGRTLGLSWKFRRKRILGASPVNRR